MLAPPHIRILYLGKQVIRVIRFAEIVLDVIILSRNAELNKLVFECSRLLKEAVYFSVDCHALKEFASSLLYASISLRL